MTDKSNESASSKRVDARDSLPEPLREEYDKFVDDYRYAATVRHNRPYVSYIVLADMIRAGWRRVASPIEPDPDSSGQKE